jgi:hypothetical protein
MNSLGLVRTTVDVDLLVDSASENQRKVCEALLILPDQAIREHGADEDLQNGLLLESTTRIGSISNTSSRSMIKMISVKHQDIRAKGGIRS